MPSTPALLSEALLEQNQNRGSTWTSHKPDVMKDPKCILQQLLVWVFLGMDLEVLISLEGVDITSFSIPP